MGPCSGTASVTFVALTTGLDMLWMHTAMTAFTAFAVDILHGLTVPACGFPACARPRAEPALILLLPSKKDSRMPTA